jgi:hypothetical protein
MRSSRYLPTLLTLALLPVLPACEDSARKPSGEPDEADEMAACCESQETPDSLQLAPERRDIDAPVEESARSVEPPVASAPLAARAELQQIETAPTESGQQPALAEQCAVEQIVRGSLDRHGLVARAGSFEWLTDTYLVTALVSGKVSIASEVQPIGDAYVLGYGFPFDVQTVDGLGQLSGLPDNALDDGKARIDLDVQAGEQYVLTFKQLIGPASTGEGWRYGLRFCAQSLRVEGKLSGPG